MMLKVIHAQENKESAHKKAAQVAEKLRKMKLGMAAKKFQDGVEKTSPTWTFQPKTRAGY